MQNEPFEQMLPGSSDHERHLGMGIQQRLEQTRQVLPERWQLLELVDHQHRRFLGGRALSQRRIDVGDDVLQLARGHPGGKPEYRRLTADLDRRSDPEAPDEVRQRILHPVPPPGRRVEGGTGQP
ncbi:MAG: hypothetical protein FWF28_04530 [Micrococcales bacterium]|nr:hypothetical protein [Micrococcales bacterium]